MQTVNINLLFSLLKVLWRTDQLHVPGGSEDELFLAQPNGGWILHPGAQALLPWLFIVWTAASRPTQSDLGAFYRGAHSGDTTHDCSSGVEE